MRKFILYLILGVALSIGMNAAPLLQADEPLVYAQIDVQDYQPQSDFGTIGTVPTVSIVSIVPIVGYIDQFRLCGADDSYSYKTGRDIRDFKGFKEFREFRS
jgi:hypothetical protein